MLSIQPFGFQAIDAIKRQLLGLNNLEILIGRYNEQTDIFYYFTVSSVPLGFKPVSMLYKPHTCPCSF